jgi:hypothetical protein
VPIDTVLAQKTPGLVTWFEMLHLDAPVCARRIAAGRHVLFNTLDVLQARCHREDEQVDSLIDYRRVASANGLSR